MTPLAPDLSAFLQTHLPNKCGASRHTIAAYARAFTLLLRFVAGQRKRAPSELVIEDLDVQKIRTFLEHIEEKLALLEAHHAPLIKPGKFREPSDKLMQILAIAAPRS